MLKQAFFGKKHSKFKPNFVIKTFITSETIYWSAQQLIAPILAIFIADELKGGSVEIAGMLVSIYWISRIFAELFSTKFLNNSKSKSKVIVVITGFILVGIATLSYSFVTTLLPFVILYAINGIGLGIAGPQRTSLFATHLDKGYETTESGIYDAIQFSGIALASALGGFIASRLGFNHLFIIAGTLSILSTIPYFLILNSKDLK